MWKIEKKEIWRLLWIIYLITIIKTIIFKYPVERLIEISNTWTKEVVWEGLFNANFTLGKSIKMYIRYFNKFPFWNGVANLFGNFIAFIPFGIFLPICYEDCRSFWKVLFFALMFVVFIEMFQLLSAFGIFDVDDILLNVSGAITGYLFYFLASDRN